MAAPRPRKGIGFALGTIGQLEFCIKRLALADLGVTGPLCSTLWSYLCSKITEGTVDFYAPRPLPGGEPNPRLGCWGYRPDLQVQGMQSDCALAVVMGVSVATAGTRALGDDRAYLRRLRDTLAESLPTGSWSRSDPSGQARKGEG